MLGIGWRLLLLALGGLTGYGLAYGVTLDDLTALLAKVQPSQTTEEAAPIDEPAPPVDRPEVRCDPPPDAVLASGAAAEVPDEDQRPRMEMASWTLSRDPQTPMEWYQAYASEDRDEERAGPAEERIAELISEVATPGLRTEYLRCATRFCTIAGFVNAESGFDSCNIGNWIGAAAVFRGSLRYSCVDEDFDGGRRFIVFVDTAPAS